jgi:hypothetical protein
MKMTQKTTYSQEQLDIALLKNTQEGILREIHGLGANMTSLSSDLRSELHSMRDEIRSQGHWNIGLILGIYAMIGAAALGKVFGVM